MVRFGVESEKESGIENEDFKRGAMEQPCNISLFSWLWNLNGA